MNTYRLVNYRGNGHCCRVDRCHRHQSRRLKGQSLRSMSSPTDIRMWTLTPRWNECSIAANGKVNFELLRLNVKHALIFTFHLNFLISQFWLDFIQILFKFHYLCLNFVYISLSFNFVRNVCLSVSISFEFFTFFSLFSSFSSFYFFLFLIFACFCIILHIFAFFLLFS